MTYLVDLYLSYRISWREAYHITRRWLPPGPEVGKSIVPVGNGAVFDGFV